MVTSSVEPVQQLVQWRTQLDGLVSADENALVPPADQLGIENTIAAGIAVLAGEAMPTPSTNEPTRAILARDLRITADLVLRALQNH